MIRVARARRLGKAKFIVGDCFQLPSLCQGGRDLFAGRAALALRPRAGRGHSQRRGHALAPGGFLVIDFLNEAARTRQRHAPEDKNWLPAKKSSRWPAAPVSPPPGF